MKDSTIISHRFCGPPDSGNGGYVCGLLAQALDSGAPIVRLHRPPPLEKPLAIRTDTSTAQLLDGEVLLAEARPGTIVLELPKAPSHEQARAAAERFRGFEEHFFPTCFVCGPDRAAGDGLRIFPGPLEDTGSVACPWIPDASLASDGHRIDAPLVWAALDCPGAFSFPQPESPMLLGELQVELRGEVVADEPCVLVAWPLSHEGRKHRTATALYGATGDCRGISIATWIEIHKR